MLGNYLFTAFFELAGDRRPGIVRVDERAPRVAKRLAAGGVAQQPDDRMGKIVGRVCGEKMAARFEREPFGTNAGCLSTTRSQRYSRTTC